jgi:hypothetical protein
MAKKKAKQGASSSASTAGAATATKSTSQPVTAQNAPKSVAAQVRSSRKRRQQRVNMAIGAGVATVIVAGIAMQVIRNANLPGERYPSQGNLHLVSLNTPHVPYNSDPPTSGPHMPNIISWGSYLEPVADEYLVHNMEDAGVILWYQMGTPEENAAEVAALEQVSRGYRRIVIVPREDLGSKYVLTAWQRLQRFDELDEEGMRRFIDAYEGIDHHPR